MHEVAKHTFGTSISGLGFFGSIIVADHWASFVCACLGSIAAICTIHSWWKHRDK